MKKSKIVFGLLVLFLVASFAVPNLRSALSDIFALQGGGSLYNKDVFRITSTGDVYITDSSSYTGMLIDSTTGELTAYSGDLVMGGNGSQPSTSNYYGLKIALKNCGASAWAAGNLITVDDNEAGCGRVSPATLDLTDWVGISEGTVAAGSVGYVTVGGYALALTTGTVNRGDCIVSTGTVAGYMGADTTPTTGADIGVALSSGTAAGGLTLIRLR